MQNNTKRPLLHTTRSHTFSFLPYLDTLRNKLPQASHAIPTLVEVFPLAIFIDFIRVQ